MTEYDRIGRINEWLEDNEFHKTDENILDNYSILQMRTLFRYWHSVSITNRSIVQGSLILTRILSAFNGEAVQYRNVCWKQNQR